MNTFPDIKWTGSVYINGSILGSLLPRHPVNKCTRNGLINIWIPGIGNSPLRPMKRVHGFRVFRVVGMDPWIGRLPVVLDLGSWAIGVIHY